MQRLFFWWSLSPAFLLLTLFALHLHQESLVPFYLVTLFGLLMVVLWKRRGFFLALAALGLTAVWQRPDLFKVLALSSVALGFLILLQGQNQIMTLFLNLREQSERREAALHEREERHKQMQEKYALLSQEISSYERKEKALERALENAEAELIKVKYTERDSRIGIWQGDAQNLSQAKPAPKQLNLKSLAMQADLKVCGCPTMPEPILESRSVYTEPQSSVIPQEEPQDPIEEVQLRQQFEEKSQLLSETRKELFQAESRLLALQKEGEEKEHSFSEEDQALLSHLQQVEAECRDLEAQVADLQDLISTLLTPKAPRTRKVKEGTELPLLLQEKIDQNIVPSFLEES